LTAPFRASPELSSTSPKARPVNVAAVPVGMELGASARRRSISLVASPPRVTRDGVGARDSRQTIAAVALPGRASRGDRVAEQDNARYVFYLAQSCRDCGKLEQAVARRIARPQRAPAERRPPARIRARRAWRPRSVSACPCSRLSPRPSRRSDQFGTRGTQAVEAWQYG